MVQGKEFISPLLFFPFLSSPLYEFCLFTSFSLLQHTHLQILSFFIRLARYKSCFLSSPFPALPHSFCSAKLILFVIEKNWLVRRNVPIFSLIPSIVILYDENEGREFTKENYFSLLSFIFLNFIYATSSQKIGQQWSFRM